ncbi:hypothetical protein VSVS12_03296 [Vibrio scophthalmi]|uniref:hypothetical protein n=1 Tax=Vibrio scophthalmi TaxID=45658 RepID=UPI0008095856|nr:hypothetical protein [Vibrio scophthalmi]ANS87005.1 hypothetical protein VSVS12_03296 [Vibrio scophthalmi]
MFEYKQVSVVFKQETTESYQGIELLSFNLDSTEHQVQAQFSFIDGYSEESADTQWVTELTLPNIIKVSLLLQHQTPKFAIEILGSEEEAVMTDAFYWLGDSLIFHNGHNVDLTPKWTNLVCQGASFDEFGHAMARAINTINTQIEQQVKLMATEQYIPTRTVH